MIIAESCDDHDFAGVVDPGDPGPVPHTAGNDKLSVGAVVDARGQPREQSLSRCQQSASEQTPLPAVGVAGKNQIDVSVCKIGWIVFRMVAEKDSAAVLFFIFRQPFQFRVRRRGIAAPVGLALFCDNARRQTAYQELR